MAWQQIPCLPYSPPGVNWTAMCFMLEGYSDEQHTHWTNGREEVITIHGPDQPRVEPNCYVRRN